MMIFKTPNRRINWCGDKAQKSADQAVGHNGGTKYAFYITEHNPPEADKLPA
jgi:hypothetical protein